MKNLAALFVIIGIMAFGMGVATGKHHEVKIQEKQGLGRYLTDTEGNTLYWFTKDSVGKSACEGACIEKWPAYFRETVQPPKGTDAKDFGTITRQDGKKQTTFRGYPLYYWANDQKPGDTTGQGVNNVWFVINPDNFPPK